MLRELWLSVLFFCIAKAWSRTSLPPPTQHTYEMRNGAGELCFVFMGGLYVQVVYPTANGSFNVANIDVGRGKDIEVFGECEHENKAIPVISFIYGLDSLIGLTFNTSVEDNGFVFMQHQIVSGSLSKLDFPDMAGGDAREIGGTNFIHYNLSRPDEFWGCNDSFTDPISEDISLVFGIEKWQAFRVHGNFSDHGVWCNLPTPPSEHSPVMTYTVTNSNIFCVVLRGSLKLTIPYSTGMDFVIRKIAGLPIDTVTDTYSSCTHGGEQYLRLDFYNQWMLAFHFTKNDSSFSVTQIDLTYYVNDIDFPNFKLGTGGLLKVVTKMQSTLKAMIGGSYRCSNGESLTLNNGIILDTNNFQVKAFSVDTKPDFSKEHVTDCHAGYRVNSGDQDTNTKVPITAIIVPVIVSGTVVAVAIVLSKLFFRRHRKRKEYELISF